MPEVDSMWVALFWGKVFASAFFSVLFLQSGSDKVFDSKGNLEYLTGHFAKSPLKGMVPLLFVLITVIEVSAGLANAVGVVAHFVGGPTWVPVLGIGLALLALLCLFAGQRIAKDYVGAAVLAAYFAVGLVATYLMSLAPKAHIVIAT